MGYVRHDVIVVTSWKRQAVEKSAAKAREIGLIVVGPGASATNGYWTMLVCPDGSKEGWAESDAYDFKRSIYLDYLNGVRCEDNSSCLEWVALAYGSDDRKATITAHAWQAYRVRGKNKRMKKENGVCYPKGMKCQMREGGLKK